MGEIANRTLDWEEIEEACDAIATQVINTGLELEAIVGISRGGLIPATILAHLLGVKRVISYQVSSYNAGVQGAIQDLNDRSHLFKSLEGYANVLVMEDIVDTGNTMGYLKKHFNRPGGAKIAYASLVVKGHKAPEHNHPDFWHHNILEPTWIQFPWEMPGLESVEEEEMPF